MPAPLPTVCVIGAGSCGIAADRKARHKRHVASKRHTIQVGFDDDLADLAKEREAGTA